MIINIVWGKSEGSTTASAFDGSLYQAGLHNFNLIRLSSVIPPKSIIKTIGTYSSQHKVGDVRYVVLSSFSSDKPGTEITCGLGWVKNEYGGLFCESYGEYNMDECNNQLHKSLQEMISMRGWSGNIKVKLISHVVEDTANVIVAAVYDFGKKESI